MSVLAIDNFAKLDTVRIGPMQLGWLKARYHMFGQFTANSYARIAEVGDRTVMRMEGRSTSQANWNFSLPIPNVNSTYVLGMRLLDLPSASPGSASFGIIANANGDQYDLVLGFGISTAGLTIHYATADGPQTETITDPISANPYIDISFEKRSTDPNDMSRLIVMVDNFPYYIGDLFNNVGSNLSIAFGALPTEPNAASPGYVRTTQLADQAPTALNYGLTDMYLSDQGLRFGNPVVSHADIQSLDTTLVPNVEQPIEEVLNQIPDPWSYGQGIGQTVSQFSQPAGQLAQYSALIQSQGGTVNVALHAGGQSTNRQVGGPQFVSVVSSNVTEATLEINP